MADVKWIKIVTDIFDDEKVLLIETLPEADSIIVIWFKLLCLAGKQNNSGVFMMNDKMPYNEKMFATIFRRKESTIQLALKTFEEFGMIEIIEGAVTIPNWGKHQNFDKIEANNEYMRNYMREYREKQKLLINSKVNSKVNVRPLDKNREEKNREEKNIYDDLPRELHQPLKDYIDSRKKLRKPMTDKAKELMLKKLNKLSDGDIGKSIAILEQSIENGWVGIFPLKEDKAVNPFKEALRKEIENEQKGSYSNYDSYQGGLSQLLSEPSGD